MVTYSGFSVYVAVVNVSWTSFSCQKKNVIP